MANISTKLIKELRDRTNIGVMECKQALINSNGNIQLAIDNMRKNGTIKVAKRSGKMTKEGRIFIKTTENKKYGIILELNCETDFVKNNDIFKKFGNNVINTSLKNNITDLQTLQKHFENERKMIISILDENINIQRITHIQGEFIGSYLHNNKKIGVIVAISGQNPNEKNLLKNIAMHIAANKPEYIDRKHIPEDIINHEKNIQMNIAIQTGKSHQLANTITTGRINKFINEICLVNQLFIMDTQKTIMELLHENNIIINHFIRFEVGEKHKNN